MQLSPILSIIALLIAEALAHGAVTSYVIGGVTYPGWDCSYLEAHRIGG